MIRLLLSLLALVSGLAIEAVPAGARPCAPCETGINTPAPASEADQTAIRPTALATMPSAPTAPALHPGPNMPETQTGLRPGVLIGIDRAHE